MIKVINFQNKIDDFLKKFKTDKNMCKDGSDFGQVVGAAIPHRARAGPGPRAQTQGPKPWAWQAAHWFLPEHVTRLPLKTFVKKS